MTLRLYLLSADEISIIAMYCLNPMLYEHARSELVPILCAANAAQTGHNPYNYLVNIVKRPNYVPMFVNTFASRTIAIDTFYFYNWNKIENNIVSLDIVEKNNVERNNVERNRNKRNRNEKNKAEENETVINYVKKPIVRAAPRPALIYNDLEEFLSAPRHTIPDPYSHLAMFCSKPLNKVELNELSELSSIDINKLDKLPNVSALAVLFHLFNKLLIDTAARKCKSNFDKEVKEREGYFYWAKINISFTPSLNEIVSPPFRDSLADMVRKYYPDTWRYKLSDYLQKIIHYNNFIPHMLAAECINNPLIVCETKKELELRHKGAKRYIL